MESNLLQGSGTCQINKEAKDGASAREKNFEGTNINPLIKMTSPFGRPKRRPYIVTLFIAFVLVLSGEPFQAHAEEALSAYHFRGHTKGGRS